MVLVIGLLGPSQVDMIFWNHLSQANYRTQCLQDVNIICCIKDYISVSNISIVFPTKTVIHIFVFVLC